LAISAISAGTDQESVCQLTQNWHNGSHFVRASKQCSERPFRLATRAARGPRRGLLRGPSTSVCLRVIERDPEAPWALVIATVTTIDMRGPDQFPAPTFG
jgi:hypothetical protein